MRIAHLTTVDLTLHALLRGQLRALQAEGFDVHTISAPGPWVPSLEGQGIRHIPWAHATRAWHPASDVLAFVELIDILRRERFDLLHTHNPKPGIMGRLAGRIAGVPCVVNTVHGLYATPASSLAQRATVLALERLAARFSDLELYQSEEDLRWAIRRRVVKPWKARYLGNGCDLTRFDPASVSPARLGELRAQLGILDGTLVVGAVGRLVAEKGYRELFEAARRVRSEQPGVAFIVVGAADPDKSDSISEEEMATASAEVTFLGWRDDVRDLLALMDVFVLASWREGFPRSAIEAAAMGKALVLTDIRGCREVARHGREALLVPPRQPAPLAAAITRLVADERLRRELGTAARTRALDAFDEGRVARTVLDGYREVLSRQGRAAPQSNLTVRRARPRDVSDMAILHATSMPEAFLPILGRRFLRLLYRALVDDPDAVVLVAEERGGVVAFAAAVPSTGGFYRRFALRYGALAALAVAPRLARPGTLRRLLETASYRTGADLPPAELLSIAVAPAHRSRGVGRALAQRALTLLGERGVEQVRVVVGSANAGANRFYAHVGFQRWGEIAVHRGTPSTVWVIECRSSLPSGSPYS